MTSTTPTNEAMTYEEMEVVVAQQQAERSRTERFATLSPSARLRALRESRIR